MRRPIANLEAVDRLTTIKRILASILCILIRRETAGCYSCKKLTQNKTSLFLYKERPRKVAILISNAALLNESSRIFIHWMSL